MPTLSNPVRFGLFELDLNSGELRKGGIKVRLADQPLQILTLLLENSGQVVTREDLHRRLWSSDTFVDFDHGLNAAVKRLREALSDSADQPRFIETLPRHGYRFIAPVESIAAAHPAPVSQPSAPPTRYRRAVRMAVVLAATSLAIAVALVAFNVHGWRRRLFVASPEPPIRSLAVLPFMNLSGDPQQEYFADGMTDALITDLARIRAVRVISRTSVMQFKNAKKPLPEIARSLGVDGILEGTVQRSGGRVRITAQLIRAPADVHLWAQSYERDVRDVLTLEGEIAQDVAREIRVALTAAESAHLVRTRSVNPEAYEAYLKGQSHWYWLSKEHLDTALEYFELARDRDPAYAQAYAGIANVWMMRADTGFMKPTEALPQAKAAASQALDLDDSVSDAHIVLANILEAYDHDWTAAEREFRRAIELNPNSVDGHFMYADFLISSKREAEWNLEIHRTLELDPFNPFFQCFYGWHLIYLDRNDEAIVQLRKVLATAPDFSSAHMGLWGAYYKKGFRGEALAEARKFFSVLHDREVADALAPGESQGGYTRAMQLGAEVLAARSRRTHVPAVRIARLYAHAGNREETLRWLEKAYEQRETPLTHLAVAWDWDFLHADPRFQDLLRRVGLNP